MRASRWLSFATVMAVASFATGCVPAYRATWTYPDRSHDHDYDRDDASNRIAYQDGLRQGRFDAQRNLSSRPYDNRWRNDADRRAYYIGYTRAYQDTMADNRDHDRDRDGDRDHDRVHDRDHDRDNDRDHNRNGNGQGSAYYHDTARQTGYQDGVKDGSHDKQNGHSFRPTEGDNYKNADRGYLSDMGEKDQYKLWYREGYSGGYKYGWDTNNRR
jgi:hypothetical protein